MKRIILTLLSLLVMLTSFAQSSNEHLKFMGVPITESITQFQSKLTQKGCTYDKKTSAILPAGARAFKGTFVGNEVDIFAFYDTKTKIVYRVKAFINGTSEDIAEQEYNRIKELLSQKYGTKNMETNTKEGKESVCFTSLKNPSEHTHLTQKNLVDVANGYIDLYIAKDKQSLSRSPYNYNLHIDYYDAKNYDAHINQEKDEKQVITKQYLEYVKQCYINACKEMNKQLPIEIDEITTLTNVAFMNWTITCIYRINLDLSDYTMDDCQDFMKEMRQDNIVNAKRMVMSRGNVSQYQLKEVIKASGLKLCLSYFDENGLFVGSNVYNYKDFFSNE